MQRYIAGRIIQALVTLWAVATIVFILVQLSGDPLEVMMPPEAKRADWERMRHALGIDRPVWVQYGTFMAKAVRLDFGESWAWRDNALKVVLDRFPATLQLTFAALFISLLIALPFGTISAVYKGSLFDRFAKIFALIGQSAPTFWLGIMLIMLFAVGLRILPTSGRGGLDHLVLPAFTLGYWTVAAITRITRSAMLDVLDSEYIKMARIKGTPERMVILKHAFKNASIPIVTYLGLDLGALLRGAVLTETVFAWPGVGRLSVEAVLARDFPAVEASILLTAALFIGLNLIVDITYGYLDPRISYR